MTAMTLAQALLKISKTENPVMATLAEALIPTAVHFSEKGAFWTKEMNERLFALLSRQIAASEEPTIVFEALVSIDEYLARNTGLIGPFACRFASTAAVLISHIETAVRKERMERTAAESAPIFDFGKKTMCAVLAAPVGRLGAALFADRILCEALKNKPIKLKLIARLESAEAEEISDVLETLCLDLAEQRITVKVDTGEAAPLNILQNIRSKKQA